MTSYTWNFQNCTCVFTIFVKFDIIFSGSNDKYSLVLLQIINYVYSPWKMPWMLYCLNNSGTRFLSTESWNYSISWWFLSLYHYVRNFCNLIGLEQWYFSLIWNTYMWKLQTFCGWWYKQIIARFIITYNNFEISLVVFMPISLQIMLLPILIFFQADPLDRNTCQRE